MDSVQNNPGKVKTSSTHKGSQFRIKQFGEDVCSCLHLKPTVLLRNVDVKITTMNL